MLIVHCSLLRPKKYEAIKYLNDPPLQMNLHNYQLVFQFPSLNSPLNAPILNCEPSHIDRPNKLEQSWHQFDCWLGWSNLNGDQLLVKWVEVKVKILGELHEVAP